MVFTLPAPGPSWQWSGDDGCSLLTKPRALLLVDEGHTASLCLRPMSTADASLSPPSPVVLTGNHRASLVLVMDDHNDGGHVGSPQPPFVVDYKTGKTLKAIFFSRPSSSESYIFSIEKFTTVLSFSKYVRTFSPHNYG